MIAGEDIVYEARRERAFGYGNGAHTAWDLESKITGRLPVVFANQDVKVVATELKLYKRLTENDWLVGKIDWLGIHEKIGLIAGDHKTGTSHDNWQAPVYHFLTHVNIRPEIFPFDIDQKIKAVSPKQFWYTSLDKATNKTVVDIVKLTYPENQEQWELPDATTYTLGYNWIMTILSEIKSELGLK
ncbi:hypothetical protein [Caudoviricetes sp.]|nr:hypothetical protein [Caudoviricetes sp.]